MLTVNPGTYEILKRSQFEYNTTKATTPALIRIDLQHFLCAYAGPCDNGYAVVLMVDVFNSITKGPALVYDANKSITPDLAWIEGNRYVCVYEGPSVDAWSNVFVVNTNDWSITVDLRAEYDPVGGETPCIVKIVQDEEIRFLCVYQGTNNDGWAVILNTRPLLP